MDIKGKKAIVLGGTSGIGLAAVEQLVAGGARVIAGSRTERALPKGARFQAIDVLDRAGLEALFTANAGFDILVNAATGGERATGPFLQMDLDGFQGSFRKLWGYVNSVRLGAPHMAPNGAIVLVSGSPARKAPPGYSAISTVGNAVEGFARAIAVEIAPRRLNVVSPGFIDTPMFPLQGEARANFITRATANNPIKRAGTATEVADAILFLIRNEYATGTTVDVDGGALLP
ncbi:MAG: SDR family oxidoreductase [Gammaproteobacteria bacterium]|nr:SDR family oxidoreductase [Gammaproteobacteria bacterium]